METSVSLTSVDLRVSRLRLERTQVTVDRGGQSRLGAGAQRPVPAPPRPEATPAQAPEKNQPEVEARLDAAATELQRALPEAQTAPGGQQRAASSYRRSLEGLRAAAAPPRPQVSVRV